MSYLSPGDMLVIPCAGFVYLVLNFKGLYANDRFEEYFVIRSSPTTFVIGESVMYDTLEDHLLIDPEIESFIFRSEDASC